MVDTANVDGQQRPARRQKQKVGRLSVMSAGLVACLTSCLLALRQHDSRANAQGGDECEESAVGKRHKALSLNELKQTTLTWGHDK